MPDLVRDNLRLRILHDIAYFGGGCTLVEFALRLVEKRNFAAYFSCGGKLALEQTEQCCFAAAGLSAEHDKFALANGKRNVFERGRSGIGI